jgi:hypothetical protein
LRKWFNDRLNKVGITTIGELRKKDIDMIIVSTNLRARASFKTYQDEDNVVDALLDSCGLPFLFRIWNSNSGPIYVDGGICENLPSSLLQSSDNDGDVIAISFEPTPTIEPKDFLSFSLALLDTAITTSVRKAQDALSDSNVYPIRTHIETFDFKYALSHGLDDDHYNLAKKNARDWFDKYLYKKNENRKAFGSDPWRSTDPTSISVMESISDIYERQHVPSKFLYHKCRFLIDAYSLLKPDELGYGLPDILEFSFQFEAYDDPIYCVRFGLLEIPHPVNFFKDSIYCKVHDPDGNNVKITQVPAIDRKNKKSRDICIFFDSPIRKGQGIHTIIFTQQASNVLDTDSNGNVVDDMIFFQTRAVGQISEIHFILRLPMSFDKTHLAGKSMSNPGNAMDDSMIFQLGYASKNPDFKTLGWVVKNISAEDKSCGIDMTAKRG